jgi:hypothetical protein
VALHDLQIERQERDRAEERDADDEADRACRRKSLVAEELERQNRLGGSRLDEREEGEQRDAARDHDEQRGRSPRVRRSAEAGVEDDAREAAGEDERPEVIDLVPPARLARLEHGPDHGDREDADREVDVEDPAPREVVDEEAAEQRPGDGRDPERRTEEALVAAAVARRDEIPDDGHCDHHQPPAAEPLDPTEHDQLGHALRRATQRRAGEEDDDRRLQDALAPVHVAELPVQR